MFVHPFYTDTQPTNRAVIGATVTSYPTRDMPIPSRTDRCSIYFKLTSASSTVSVTIKARMVYGDVLGDEFTLDTVTATTSGAYTSKRLERDFSGYFDPNASDIRVTFSKASGIAVTVEGGMSANPSR